MHPEIQKLLKLQLIDGRLELLRKELQSRPGLVEEQDSRVIAIGKRRAQLQVEHKEKKMEIDRIDLEIKSQDSKIAELRKKLNLVRTNKEFAALNQEILGIETEKSTIEDQLLGVWEERDRLQKGERELDRELQEARRLLAEERKLAESEAEQIRKEAEQLMAEREAALNPIGDKLLGDYEVLFSRYRERSIVIAEGAVCGGCNMTLSPQVINQLHDDSAVVSCGNCGRLLYL